MGGAGIPAVGGVDGADASRSRRALVLVNQNSRQGGGEIGDALATLERGGLSLRHAAPENPEAMQKAIHAAAEDCDCVIVGGGDGTLNAAAPALRATGLPLGILPLGTANDLARTLDIPFDVGEAAAIIAAGHVRRVDLGEVNDVPFFNVASIGLSTRIADELTGAVKQRWGRLGYAITTLRTVARMRPFSAEIHVDGKTRRVRTWQISVGNGRHYGGGMTVEAEAQIDDGLLDLYSLEFDRAWKLALVYPAFRKGKHGLWKEVRTVSCAQAEIRTRRPMPVNTDGEITTQTPARFRVLPKAVSVFVAHKSPA
jgi:YegS/Rv2252/BmrU family lipid kinase